MTKLHIELTNRCTLACPPCPRTEWANILKRSIPKQDLDYRLLDNFLDCEGGRKIDTFNLCGDFGDCIYYPKFLECIEHFRNTKKFSIHTNGSHQSAAFWQNLCALLTDQDQVVFAIDGLGDDNKIYRKNSNWDSIMQAIDILSKGSVKIAWQTIVFRFNQDKLEEIKSFAESKGARYVQLITHRYGDKALIPTSSAHIEKIYFYKKEYNTEAIEIAPQCADVGTIATVGCDGIFYPCDWLRNPNVFYKSQLWKDKSRWLDKLHIGKTTYDSARSVIEDWAHTVHSNSICGGPVDVLCKMKCRKEL